MSNRGPVGEKESTAVFFHPMKRKVPGIFPGTFSFRDGTAEISVVKYDLEAEAA